MVTFRDDGNVILLYEDDVIHSLDGRSKGLAESMETHHIPTSKWSKVHRLGSGRSLLDPFRRSPPPLPRVEKL